MKLHGLFSVKGVVCYPLYITFEEWLFGSLDKIHMYV